MSPRFDVYVDQAGQWRWSFHAANGLIVADCGEGYSSKQACLHGLMVTKAAVAKAKVNIVETPAQKVARVLVGRGILSGVTLR
jgi:uncharacterized protein YegP (UPF0339 family)